MTAAVVERPPAEVSARTRRVFIEFPWASHNYYHSLAGAPPEGYEFVVAPEPRWVARARKVGSLRFAHMDLADRLLPMNRVRSYTGRRAQPPPGTDLTLAVNHVVLRDEPWILEAEHAAFPVSYRVERLNSPRYRRWLEAALRAPNCRAIVSFNHAAQQTFERNLDCRGFEHKFAVVPLAVPVPREAAPHLEGARPLVLFVGSGNLGGMFYEKGGPTLVRTYEALRAMHPDADLVVRAEVPPAFRPALDAAGARVLDQRLSAEALDALFRSASVLLFPGHHTPWTAILEGMAYGLPVVATDVHANAELVRDGETGFVVRRSEQVPYFWHRFVRDGERVPGLDAYRRATRRPDERIARELAERTSMLLTQPDLRRHMGAAARAEVECGEHSIAHRNRLLKQVLDGATAEGGSPTAIAPLGEKDVP